MSDDDRVFIGDQANRDQTQTINKFDEIIALLRDIKHGWQSSSKRC